MFPNFTGKLIRSVEPFRLAEILLHDIINADSCRIRLHSQENRKLILHVEANPKAMSSRTPAELWSEYLHPSQRKGEPNGRPVSNNIQRSEARHRSDRGPSASRKTTLNNASGQWRTGIVSHELPATNSRAILNRPGVFEVLLHETHESLLRVQKASRCLTAEEPNREYGANKFKWCANLCRVAWLACRFSNRDTRSQTPSIRLLTVIEQFFEDLTHVFSGLFCRLTLLYRVSAALRPGRLMIVDLCTVFLDMGNIDVIQEGLWVEGFAQLKKLINVTHDPWQSVKALHQMISHCIGPRNLARYHLYLHLYDIVYACYRNDAKSANEDFE